MIIYQLYVKLKIKQFQKKIIKIGDKHYLIWRVKYIPLPLLSWLFKFSEKISCKFVWNLKNVKQERVLKYEKDLKLNPKSMRCNRTDIRPNKNLLRISWSIRGGIIVRDSARRIIVNLCHFHFSNCICKRGQYLGLATTYKGEKGCPVIESAGICTT